MTLCVVVGAISLIGSFVYGADFLIRPLPFPEMVAGVWFAFNWALAIMAAYLVSRNSLTFRERWTWQEMAFSRGVFLLLFGAVLGYTARIFNDPTVTLAAPLFTIGLLLLIWASVRFPERFEDEDVDARREGVQMFYDGGESDGRKR